MKKTVFLMAMLCLFALGVCAQSKPDFSGTWTLDKSKSKLSEMEAARIESVTMTVAQTANDIKIDTATKRTPPPEGGQGGMGGGRGMGGRGMMGGGDGSRTFTFDGKEVTTEVEFGQMGKVPQKSKAEFGDGKLKLMTSRTFSGPQGETTVKNSETWELTDGGKTLKVKTETESPRGTQTSERVFTKS